MNYEIEYHESEYGKIGNDEIWHSKNEQFEKLYFDNSVASYLKDAGFNFNSCLGVWHKDNTFARAFVIGSGRRCSSIGDKKEKI